jgi:cytochrome c553
MIRFSFAVAMCATAFSTLAQQPAPAAPPPPAAQPPAFAPPNLTASGVKAMAANCAACHGTHGKPAAGSPVPALAGRSGAELADIMAQFKEGKRGPTVMHQIAKGYTEAEIAALGGHFSQLSR